MIAAQERAKAHEGYRDHVYCDLCGKPWRECQASQVRAAMVRTSLPCKGGSMTIGWGYNLENGISADIAHQLFMLKWGEAELRARRISQGWPENAANTARLGAVTELCYMMGSLSAFPGFQAALVRMDWELARKELLFAGKRQCKTCGGHALGCAHCEHTGKDHSKLWYDMRCGLPGWQRAERLAEIIRSGADPVLSV